MKSSLLLKIAPPAAAILVGVTLGIVLGFTGSANAASGAEKLKRLLSNHPFTGAPITRDVKAATGDPNIHVIDRRYEFGEIYRCSYMFQQGRRIMICD